MKTTLAKTQPAILRVAAKAPKAAEKPNTFAKDVDSLSTKKGAMVNIAKLVEERRAPTSNTEEALEQLKFPRLDPARPFETRLATFIKANSGRDDERYFGALDSANLGMHAYVLEGKAAANLLSLIRKWSEVPTFDAEKYAVLAVLQTFDEPDVKTLILDKATMRPLFADSGLNPLSLDLEKDLPPAIKNDARVYQDGEIDGFKAIAALLQPGTKINLKLKDKSHQAWTVDRWLKS